MKRLIILMIFAASLNVMAQNKNIPIVSGRTLNFDKEWLFFRGAAENAEQPSYNDSHWRKVTLPHDWSIENLPHQVPDSIVGPFDKGSHGKLATGFTIGGTGWYRKRFKTSQAMSGKNVTVSFDGVYMNSDVWINGHHLGNHPYGYTPFYYDLTPFLEHSGAENVLAVRVRNEGKNSRWYSGSGIYRHVVLLVTSPVHVAPYGVFVTSPKVSAAETTLNINTLIQNESAEEHKITLFTTILTSEGKVAGVARDEMNLPAGKSTGKEQSVILKQAALWSPESPALYKAVTEIRESKGVIEKTETSWDGKTSTDRVSTIFGIRSLSIDAVNGLVLNGNKIELKGGCIHHDNGPLGAAAFDRAEERKLEILKRNGFNSIRLSHNPPSSALLDACDRLGLMVIDEAFDMWERGKNPDDYHLWFKEWWKKDLESMILRDRNHPSVILWSIGNEINERVDTSGLRITKQLAGEVHRLDPTRQVTEALCFFWDHQGYKWDMTAPAYELLDAGGYNYMNSMYEGDHKKFPSRVMIGTESFPQAALENWNMVEKHPWVIGDFVWTAIDYLGEASIGNSKISDKKSFQGNQDWPWFNAYCGDIDLIGNKKPQSYYRDVVWHVKPITMAVHSPLPEGKVENISMWGWPDEQQSWNWHGSEGKSLQVRVFSRAPRVRLYLNNKLVGDHEIADSKIMSVFNVPYEAGILKAVNVVNDSETEAFELATSGKPVQLRLTTDKTKISADGNDLAYVMVEVVDDKGQLVPDAELPVKFTLSGPAEIAGTGNGNPTDMAGFRQPERKTWRGSCLVILRTADGKGKIKLTASTAGLSPGRITISPEKQNLNLSDTNPQ